MMHDWFKKAKLGIFIHWGLYSVQGVHESWAMGFGKMSCEEYYKQKDGFTAENYDPEEWARFFKAAGANYAVLTTKHHEGFALFDTEYTDLNAVKATPCGRDLIEPYCKALRDQDMKVGLYFTNTDWADDDHMRVMMDMSQEELDAMRKEKVAFFEKFHQEPASEEKKAEFDECWKRFMTRYKGELKELISRYQPDVLWTDVLTPREGFSWECPEVKKMINDLCPNTICNGRLGDQGDYATPECYIPLRQWDKPWELCTTLNESFGYQTGDWNYKDVRQIVRILCECISKGGNLLISIGPDGTGVYRDIVKEKLLELGAWTHKYAEAIYPTEKGIDPAYFLGGSTLTEDRKTLYLFAYDSSSSYLVINGIANHRKIKKITAMGSGKELNYQFRDSTRCVWIDLPKEEVDDVCTVVKVEFDEPIELRNVNERPEGDGDPTKMDKDLNFFQA